MPPSARQIRPGARLPVPARRPSASSARRGGRALGEQRDRVSALPRRAAAPTVPGTAYTVSCGTTRRIRLVTSTARFGQADSSRSVSTATAFTRCSQLSSTSSARRSPSGGGQHVLGRAGPRISPRPRQASTAAGSNAWSVTGTRSTYQVPPKNWSATSAATASASLVLPIPPGPTAETSRMRRPALRPGRPARRPVRRTMSAGSAARGEAPGPGPVSAARYPAASRTSSRWVPRTACAAARRRGSPRCAPR